MVALYTLGPCTQWYVPLLKMNEHALSSFRSGPVVTTLYHRVGVIYVNDGGGAAAQTNARWPQWSLASLKKNTYQS